MIDQPITWQGDVIILGAGAAGLMCARTAALRGRKVTVLEHNERVGKKILISGGGRCNFTNLYTSPENFISQNNHFCKSALSQFTQDDFISLVQKRGIEYYEKKLGQLFCKSSAKEITEMLVQECEEAGVQLNLGQTGIKVRKNDQFQARTSHGNFQAGSLVVATGGLSFPKLGASDLGYRIARQFELQLTESRPALVPLTFSLEDESRFTHLSGVSTEVIASCGKQSFREALLFTHQGLSGPAILQISSYWKSGEELRIDLLPDEKGDEFLVEWKRRGERGQIKNLLGRLLPHRLADAWCEIYSLSRPIYEYTDTSLRQAAIQLHSWRISPSGTEGYAKAEVTLGGVDTAELSSKTMEAKKVPGLYFIGEVVDVTGHLGGHNFQWAWASGFCAGENV